MSTDEKAISIISPQINITDFKSDVQAMARLLKSAMKEGTDYGIIPGTKKKTLFDPGAEKLAKFYGLVPVYEKVKEVEDYEKGFFYYTYKCTLTHFKTGKVAGAAERSCNSFEKKYLFTSVAETWATDEQKKKAVRKEKNSKGYWNIVLRKTPEELIEAINTYQAMAQKRAFVEAVKTATMASEIFVTGVEENDVAPAAHVTMASDPGRIDLLRKIFAAGAERGFDEEAVKQNFYKKHNVDSLGKISNKQLSDSLEALILKFDIVGKGNKPKLIGVKKESIEDAEVVEDQDPFIKGLEEDKKKIAAADTFIADQQKEFECYCKCGKKITKQTAYKEYFFNKEHHEKWANIHYPTKPAAMSFQEKLEQGRRAKGILL